MNGFIEYTQDVMMNVKNYKFDIETLKVIKDKAEWKATEIA